MVEISIKSTIRDSLKHMFASFCDESLTSTPVGVPTGLPIARMHNVHHLGR